MGVCAPTPDPTPPGPAVGPPERCSRVDPKDSATKMQALLWAKITRIEQLRPQLDHSLPSFLDRIRITPPASTFTLNHWIHTYEDLFKSQAAAFKKAQKKNMPPLSHYFTRPHLDST